MDPITIGTASLHGAGGYSSATAYTLGNSTTGTVFGSTGAHPFSVLKDNILGSKFTLGADKFYTLKPDFISRVPFGHSFTVTGGGLQTPGLLGSNSITGDVSFGGGMSSQLGSIIGAATKANGML